MDNKSDENLNYPDKRILQKHKIKLGEFDVRHEIWSWKGYKTEAIIFENDDIVALTDQDIEALVVESELVKEALEININRLEKFTFVIFNFQIGTNTEFESNKG